MQIESVISNYGHRMFKVRLGRNENPTETELLEHCGYVPFLGGRLEYSNEPDIKYVLVHSN